MDLFFKVFLLCPNAGSHFVKYFRELAKFIVGGDSDFHVRVSFPNFAGTFREQSHRVCEDMRTDKCQECHSQGHGRGDNNDSTAECPNWRVSFTGVHHRNQ